MGTERELKLALSEAEAARLAALAGPLRRMLRQRNEYFDTAGGALGRRGYGLRLRDENGALRLTLKGPGRPAGALIERSETEVALDHADAEALRAGLRTLGSLPLAVAPDLAREAGASPLCSLGVLENERRVYDLGEARLELDRSLYPDGSVTHEAEIEWPDPVRPFPEAAVRDLFERAGVPWRIEPKSKLARLLERLRP
jgi:inorganic triphosphatase YgiF